MCTRDASARVFGRVFMSNAARFAERMAFGRPTMIEEHALAIMGDGDEQA